MHARLAAQPLHALRCQPHAAALQTEGTVGYNAYMQAKQRKQAKQKEKQMRNITNTESAIITRRLQETAMKMQPIINRIANAEGYSDSDYDHLEADIDRFHRLFAIDYEGFGEDGEIKELTA